MTTPVSLWSLRIERIPAKVGRPFIVEHHYSRGCHGAPTTFGCYTREGRLVGVCAFATPCSENVRAWPFGEDKGSKDGVTELHRLVMLGEEDWPERPRNALSYFVRRCLDLLPREKPLIRAVVSFADATEGHTGAIYKALNALQFGVSGKKARFWLDPATGRLHHPRQCGANITAEEAAARGWVATMREPKIKYMFLVGSKREIADTAERLLHKPINL